MIEERTKHIKERADLKRQIKNNKLMIYKQVISKIPLPSTVFCFKNHFSSIEKESKRNIIKMNAYACDNRILFPMYKEALDKDNCKRSYRHGIAHERHIRKGIINPYEPRQSSLCFKTDNKDSLSKSNNKKFQSNSKENNIKKKINNKKEITDNEIYEKAANPISPKQLIDEFSDFDINELNNHKNNDIILKKNNVRILSSMSINLNNITSRENLSKINYHFKYPSIILTSNKNMSNNKQTESLTSLKQYNKRLESNDFKQKEKRLFERKIAFGCQGVTDECQSLQSFLSKTTRHYIPLSISDEESMRLLHNDNDVMIEYLHSAKRKQKKTFSIHSHLYDNARAVKESVCLSKLNVNLALNANKILKTMIFKKKPLDKYKEYNNTDYKTLIRNHQLLYKTTMKLITKNEKAIKNIKTKLIQYNVK